ncbi:SHOCT domain-containing protein [Nocardioides sp.]|uniref:SHOCT domain-containing protein n=1 Tax=Nocardioides sp. TaxID=35761 RepID=UPI002638777F|nr:SHOCT domain-containing protein [Nocardioides sp.]
MLTQVLRLDEFNDPVLDTGMPTFFKVALIVMGIIVVLGFGSAIVSGVVRYRTTKRLAQQSGLSEADATGLALTSEHGLETAYLAQQLRGGQTSATAPSAESRLAELGALRDKGLITAEEYEAKRRAILDAL